jgi:hypothetical protein
VARQEAELAELRPYLALAREIRAEAQRAAADGSAGVDSLVDAVEAIPKRERAGFARAVFDRLPADAQWAIIEHVFDGEDVRAAIDSARQAVVERANRAAATSPLLARVRQERQLDTRDLAAQDELTLGLFREPDVRAALDRGRRSSTCARRLVLRAGDEAGTFHVIEDVFNPEGGYFVNGRYDETTWRTHERFPAHTIVRAGSITENKGAKTFAPVIYLGSRVDFERDGELLEGHLHVGYIMLGDEEVLSSEGS